MAENTQSQQRLRKVDIIGPDGTVIAQSVLISPKAEDVKVENEIIQSTATGTETKTPVSANLKDFLFKKFSSATESNGGDTIEIRAAGDDYFSIDPSKISILQSWSDYQNLNKKRLVGLYDSEGNYIADFLSGVENLDPTLAQFETTDTDANTTAVKNKYDFKGYTPVTGVAENDVLVEGQFASAEEQAAEFMASFGDSSFWQQIIDREIENKNRLLGLYDANGKVVGYFEPTVQNISEIKTAYGLETNKEAYDLVIDLGKKSLYQRLVELNNFWQDLPSEYYRKTEQSGKNIATKYDIDGLSWVPVPIPTDDYHLDFSLSVDGSLAVARNLMARQSVSIPSAVNGRPVTVIAPGAFANDTALVEVWNNTDNAQPIQINEIGKQAFFGCIQLQQIKLGNVKKIGTQAFDGCENLASVSLDNIEVIKDSAFVKCSFTTITIPDSCRALGGYAFDDCHELATVTIGNGVTEIDMHTFDDCDSLETVTLGKGIDSIDSKAFRNCTALKTIILLSTDPPRIQADTFEDLNSFGTAIIVPAGCYSAYRNATNWAKFADLIEEDE